MDSCPHCGGFHNRGSPFSEVPLYYCLGTVVRHVRMVVGKEVVTCTNFSLNAGLIHIHMWQSQVEIEHYSVAYFAHIAVFEAL